MQGRIVDLGDWAEDRFALFCSEAGIAANRSERDRTGWDFILEFARDNAVGLPPDKLEREATARVQVKSRERGPCSTRLKLDNAHRFAVEPAPCFVVLAVATDGAQPVEFYAKHFWKPEIERTLKRLRQSEKIDKPLHKQYITISFGEDDNHTDDLIEWMREISVAKSLDYATEKQKFNETVGYEDGRHFGDIKFRVDELEDFVNHTIGLTPTIKPQNLRMVDKRFGIQAQVPVFDGKPDYMVMQVEPSKCVVEVNNNENQSLKFAGDYRVPHLPGLPSNLMKANVVAGPIQILLQSEGLATVRTQFDGADSEHVGYLSKCLDLHVWASRGPIEIVVHAGAIQLDGLVVDQLVRKPDDFVDDCAILLRKLCDLESQSPCVDACLSLDELVDGYDGTREFCEYFVADSLDLDLPSETLEKAKSPIRRLLVPLCLELGGNQFTFVKLFSSVRKDLKADSLKLSFSDPATIYTQVDRAGMPAHQKSMGRIVRRLARRHGEGTLVMRFKDPENPYPFIST